MEAVGYWVCFAEVAAVSELELQCQLPDALVAFAAIPSLKCPQIAM